MCINTILRLVLMFLLSLVLFQSCKQNEQNDEVIKPIEPTKVDSIKTDSICFEQEILPIFKSNCAIEACHDGITGQEGIVFDSYATFFYKGFVPGDALKSQVYNAIVRTTSRRMPPITTVALDSNQIAKIKKWIDQGMRANTCRQVIDTNQFSYRKNLYPILKDYCFGCHNALSEHSNSIKLENFGQVKALALNGKLIGSIRHASGYRAMPENGSKMNEKLIRIIEKWIEAGALDN